LSDLPEHKSDLRLLRAMGRETANLHLGSAVRIEAVKKDLAGRKPHWLGRAAAIMAEATRSDCNKWVSI
jgi:hypothetical protein